ncbi:MAG: hypothetical protein N2111_12645 [Candidatus Sumerlaeaceae bacterium]|nr:hypothetical protein [Candidatus Sumerlaeaceae bacterium]
MKDPSSRRFSNWGGLRARSDAHHGLAERMAWPGLSTCYEHERIRPSLTGRRLLYALYLCALVAMFGLAHVHLRFRTADLKLQAQHLQDRARQLRDRAEALARRNAQLSGLDHVESVARQTLGMTASSAEDTTVVEIPRRLAARYSSIGREPDRAADGASRSRAVEDAVLAALPLQTPPEFLDAMLEIGRAFAAATGVEPKPDDNQPPPASAEQRMVEFRWIEP